LKAETTIPTLRIKNAVVEKAPLKTAMFPRRQAKSSVLMRIHIVPWKWSTKTLGSFADTVGGGVPAGTDGWLVSNSVGCCVPELIVVGGTVSVKKTLGSFVDAAGGRVPSGKDGWLVSHSVGCCVPELIVGESVVVLSRSEAGNNMSLQIWAFWQTPRLTSHHPD